MIYSYYVFGAWPSRFLAWVCLLIMSLSVIDIIVTLFLFSGIWLLTSLLLFVAGVHHLLEPLLLLNGGFILLNLGFEEGTHLEEHFFAVTAIG